MPPPNPAAQFDVDRLLRETFAADVEIHDELASTNDLAMQRVAQHDLPCPLLIVAQRQTAGRGRGQNTWWAGSGGLTFTLVLDAEAMGLPQASWPRASLVTGLAVFEAMRQLLPDEPLGLKWPNDVYLRERKLCGVLVETSRAPRPRLVIGIGLNVNNRFDDAPVEVLRRAISLHEAARTLFDRTDVLVRTLASLQRCYREVAERDSELPRRWYEACLLRERRVTLNVGERVVEGRCLGIDEEGALLIETDSVRERFFGGTVERFE